MLRLFVLFASISHAAPFAALPLVTRKGSSTLAASGSSVGVLDDGNFQELLLQQADTPVLIDACAKWCGPCKLIEPILQKCSKSWHGQVVKLDVSDSNKNPQVRLELLLQDAMPQSLPFLVLFFNGKVLAKHTGVLSEEDLDDFLAQNLAPVDPITASTSLLPSPELITSGFVKFASQASASEDYMLSNLYV